MIIKEWKDYNVIIGNSVQKRTGKQIILNDFEDFNFIICKAKPSGYCIYHLESGLLIPPINLDIATIKEAKQDAELALNKQVENVKGFREWFKKLSLNSINN